MDDQTIERTEKKYLISKVEKDQILKNLKKYLEKDKYFSSTVCNIYFDTRNDDLIINSNSHPVFKEKFRVRSYNLPTSEDTVFLETKKKLKEKREKVGAKRRLALPLKDLGKFLSGKTSLEKLFDDSDFKNLEIAKELDYAFSFYKLIPRIFICYDRESFVGNKDPGFRLTFDSNLRYRTKDLKLDSKASCKNYFKNPSKDEEKSIIMEVKTMDAMPLWFVKELSKQKIYPSSFSKYGKIYNKLNERK